MSRIHISFAKHEHTHSIVVYKVESSDFASDRLIGELTIYLESREYRFT
jgi:hypothetical protein